MSAPLGIQKTENIAAYMKAVFVAKLRGNAENVPLPNWSLGQLDLLEECNYASKIMVQATRNLSECLRISDYQGLRVGYARVRDRVGLCRPSLNPYPRHGFPGHPHCDPSHR